LTRFGLKRGDRVWSLTVGGVLLGQVFEVVYARPPRASDGAVLVGVLAVPPILGGCNSVFLEVREASLVPVTKAEEARDGID